MDDESGESTQEDDVTGCDRKTGVRVRRTGVRLTK